MYSSTNMTYNNFLTPNLFKVATLYNVEANTVQYTMSGTQSAQALSMLLYGTRQYDWVLYMVNNVVHPIYDWYMDNETLHEYITDKYEDFNGVNYFYHLTTNQRLTDTDEVNARYAYSNGTLPQFIGVKTNYEHEVDINDARATIRIVPTTSILSFITNYKRQVDSL